MAKVAIQREIQTLQRLFYRHIIQFYGTTYHEGDLVVLTDLAQGGSLKSAIEHAASSSAVAATTTGREVAYPVLDWPTRERFVQEMASGLAYIHSEGVLHLDLKSENVLLTRSFEVKLCDFGCATVKTTSASRSTESRKGTVRWMAPELFARRPQYSTKSDMFSLGVVMWEMAALCTTPFQEHLDNFVVMSLVKSGEREDLPEQTPPKYRAWVEQCWHQDPQQRPEASDLVVEEDPGRTGEDLSKGGKATDGTADNANSSMFLDLGTSGSSISAPSSTNTQSSNCSSPHDTMTTNTTGTTTTTEMAFATLWRVAIEGQVGAQVMLANLYDEGSDDIVQDESKAFAWYLQAASQGHREAQCRVGEMFMQGRGTQQSSKMAATWFQEAAQQGDPNAQVFLGTLYTFGHAVPQHDGSAAKWFSEAAIQGHPTGQLNYGIMQRLGRGVAKNMAISTIWINKAAEYGDPEARIWVECSMASDYGRRFDPGDVEAAWWLRRAIQLGEPVCPDLDLAVALATAKPTTSAASGGHQASDGDGSDRGSEDSIVSWYRRAIASGVAQFYHGLMHLEGRHVDRNFEVAAKSFHLAAQRGHTHAQYFFGWMYDVGRGLVASDVSAYAWYVSSATQGNDKEAQFHLGVMYELGIGCSQSDKEAMVWYRKAAERGHLDARRHLAWIICSTRGGAAPKGHEAALASFHRGVQSGDAAACFNLGLMHEKGRGTPKNKDQALLWYNSAAMQGHRAARARYEVLVTAAGFREPESLFRYHCQ
ncbi:hypothetical protein BGZ73_006553 [Actinomortierella ambigua]|nr:hypothetical protein BGZ73_006553 [Actinomortierella ambigua]